MKWSLRHDDAGVVDAADTFRSTNDHGRLREEEEEDDDLESNNVWVCHHTLPPAPPCENLNTGEYTIPTSSSRDGILRGALARTTTTTSRTFFMPSLFMVQGNNSLGTQQESGNETFDEFWSSEGGEDWCRGRGDNVVVIDDDDDDDDDQENMNDNNESTTKTWRNGKRNKASLEGSFLNTPMSTSSSRSLLVCWCPYFIILLILVITLPILITKKMTNSKQDNSAFVASPENGGIQVQPTTQALSSSSSSSSSSTQKQNLTTPLPTFAPTVAPTNIPTAVPTPAPSSLPPTTMTPVAMTTTEADVVIIGAGWAGLAALDYLRSLDDGKDDDGDNKKNNIILLEARDYLGGRSRTVRDLVKGGLPVELGSQWTYPDGNVDKLREDQGLPYGTTIPDMERMGLYESQTLLGRSGPELSKQDKIALMKRVWFGKNGFVKFVNSNAKDDSNFQQLVGEYVDETNLDANQEDKQFLNAMTNSDLSSEFAAPLAELSAPDTMYFLEEDYYVMHDMAVPGAGFDVLIQSIAKNHMDQIRLNATVTTVQYGAGYDNDANGNQAKVTYVDTQTGAMHSVIASAVLLTVPLGVLKHSDIQFVPALPSDKLSAINGIGYGVLDKCFLYWEDVDEVDSWWPVGKVWLDLITDVDETSGIWTFFYNGRIPENGNIPLLVAWIAGDDATAMENQADEDVLLKVLTNLRTMFGDNVPEPTTYAVTRWGQDVYSRGSYSFPLAKNTTSKDDDNDDDNGNRNALAARVGNNLFWAGEATDPEWFGTTEGAHNSGIRAGGEIQQFLSKAKK